MLETFTMEPATPRSIIWLATTCETIMTARRFDGHRFVPGLRTDYQEWLKDSNCRIVEPKDRFLQPIRAARLAAPASPNSAMIVSHPLSSFRCS
jgi:hypothetical protein